MTRSFKLKATKTNQKSAFRSNLLRFHVLYSSPELSNRNRESTCLISKPSYAISEITKPKNPMSLHFHSSLFIVKLTKRIWLYSTATAEGRGEFQCQRRSNISITGNISSKLVLWVKWHHRHVQNSDSRAF